MSIPVVRFTDERLPNGLRLIVAEDHLAPVVAVNLWYDVGSKHEVAGKTGFAHLFEHVMFQGSRERREGRAHRARPGGRRHDERHDLARPDELLRDAAVATSSSSRCGSRPTGWPRSSTRSARRTSTTSARSSRTRSAGATTTGRTASWNEKLQAHLFPPEHPYHHPTIGSMEDLDAASIEDVKRVLPDLLRAEQCGPRRRRRRRAGAGPGMDRRATSGASRPNPDDPAARRPDAPAHARRRSIARRSTTRCRCRGCTSGSARRRSATRGSTRSTLPASSSPAGRAAGSTDASCATSGSPRTSRSSRSASSAAARSPPAGRPSAPASTSSGSKRPSTRSWSGSAASP